MDVLKPSTTPGVSNGFWDTAADFAAHITRAAQSALLNQQQSFDKVVAVVVYWESGDTLKFLRKEADKLATLFADTLLFETKVYPIPDNFEAWEFIYKIGSELKKVSGDPNSLFILYYGGHAENRDATFDRRYWLKENKRGSPEIEWSSAIRALFKTGVVCHKLFIFDCCHAGGMIDQTLPWETSCELLGACAADVQASGLKVSSFTSAVCQEISENTYDVWELHSALCSTQKREAVYHLKTYPYYHDYVGRSKLSTSIVIAKKLPEAAPAADTKVVNGCNGRPSTPSDRLARLDDITDAVMCIAVTFKCSAEVFMQELEEFKKNWTRWFNFAPTETAEILVKACTRAQLNGLFNSNSCVTIWTLPIWLWDAMSPAGGFQRIGIIKPYNFAPSVSGRPLELAIAGRKLTSVLGSLAGNHTGRTNPDTSETPGAPVPNPSSIPEGPNPIERRHKNRLLNTILSKALKPIPVASASIPMYDLDEKMATVITSIELPNLIDLLDDPSEKKKASKIQRFGVSKGRRTFLGGVLQGLDMPEQARTELMMS